jgi:hypothetical protein
MRLVKHRTKVNKRFRRKRKFNRHIRNEDKPVLVVSKPTREQREDDIWKDSFNDGRLAADRKWIEAINDRIKELEIQVGIPELKKLKERTKYKWKEEDENEART